MGWLSRLLEALFSALPDFVSEWREGRRLRREELKAKLEKAKADEEAFEAAIVSGDPDLIAAARRRLQKRAPAEG